MASARGFILASDGDPRYQDALALVRADIREGYACAVTFVGPAGTTWLEIRGPKGMRPDGGTLLTSDVLTLCLWIPGQDPGPVAMAAADGPLDDGLLAIEKRARPHLHRPEQARLVELLSVVREAAPQHPAMSHLGAHIGPALDDATRLVTDVLTELRLLRAAVEALQPSGSQRDAERLALGGSAILSLGRVAELLPMSDADSRRWLRAQGLVAVLDCGDGQKEVVHRGSVLDRIQASTATPEHRPTPRRRAPLTRVDLG